jgi:hypothetical protein
LSAEFLAIIGVGTVLFLTLVRTNEHLAETNRRMQVFWEEWIKDRPR